MAFDTSLVFGARLWGVVWTVTGDACCVATLVADAQIRVWLLVALLRALHSLGCRLLMDLASLAMWIQAPSPAVHSVCNVTTLKLFKPARALGWFPPLISLPHAHFLFQQLGCRCILVRVYVLRDK